VKRAVALAAFALAAAAAPAARACAPVPAPPPAGRPAGDARIDAYQRAVARASGVVSTHVAGRSVEGRPLRYAVVTALPARRLRAGLARLRAVRAGRARSAPGAPAVVWVTGAVHGNEPSGADADLRLLHGLAARCHDPLLRRLVVVIAPVQNPDGRAAGTRVNADGFDLNRDWLAMTQPETPARLRALLRLPPLVYADQHEQGGTDFFLGPYEAPVFHELPGAAMAAERRVLRPAMRRAFAAHGFAQSPGDFDLLYPGYGDSATTLLFGASGMTLEAGSGQPFARRVAEHLTAARALLAAVARHRAALLRGWARSFATAGRQGARGELAGRGGPRVFGYALGAGAGPLVDVLQGAGVAVRRLAAPARVGVLRPFAAPADGGQATLPAGTYLVSSAQPLKHWIEAMLGEDPLAGVPSPSDVGAWSRPLLMGVAGGALGTPPPPAPAAPRPAGSAAPAPLAGMRIALLADTPIAPAPAGIEPPPEGTSWARWVLVHHLGASVDLVDDVALARGALAGHDALVVADGAPPALSPAALAAIARYVRAGGTYLGWRTPGVGIAQAAGISAARIASERPGLRIPGAAVAVGSSVVLDVDDPVLAGGTVVARYSAVLSGWSAGSPAGLPAIVDDRAGLGHATLFAFDPAFRGSSESAERLLSAALAPRAT
jgi:zinc carboxypeptidase